MDARLIAATLVLLLAGCGGGGGADIAETPSPAPAGALRIRLWHFALGSAIGMTPGTLAATVFSSEVEALLAPDAEVNWPLVAGMAAMLAVATWFVRRWFIRQQAGPAA
jgi:membrane protein DedA with SNARE-associated domain